MHTWPSESLHSRIRNDQWNPPLVGIEILTVDARIVVASVDTYLRFAEAVNRLDLTEKSKGLPEVFGDITAKHKTAGAIDAVAERVEGLFSRDENEVRND